MDGTAHLSAMFAGMLASGFARERRAANLLDGGAPFYDVYETADGEHMSVGALEPQFYAVLVELLGLDDLPSRDDPAQWPVIREAFTRRFKERTRAEWTEVFDGTDACVAPVLPVTEAARHPHLAARGTVRRPRRGPPARAGPAVLTDRGDPVHRPERARRPDPRGARGLGCPRTSTRWSSPAPPSRPDADAGQRVRRLIVSRLVSLTADS